MSDVSSAVRPTVSSWPRREMGPSTLPSICKSSVPVIWPLICRLEPRRAEPRAGLLPSAGVEGLLKATTEGFAACAGDDDSGSGCCLVHIVSSLSGGKFDSSSGWEEQRGFNLVRGWNRSNAELKLTCVARNWPRGQGGSREITNAAGGSSPIHLRRAYHTPPRSPPPPLYHS